MKMTKESIRPFDESESTAQASRESAAFTACIVTIIIILLLQDLYSGQDYYFYYEVDGEKRYDFNQDEVVYHCPVEGRDILVNTLKVPPTSTLI